MKRDCTIRVAKTKALISFAVTAKLICVFVFAYAKSRFSHNEAHLWYILLDFLRFVSSFPGFPLLLMKIEIRQFAYSDREMKDRCLTKCV